MAKHIDIGKDGELAAVAFLNHLGHQILETNWRSTPYEIDIISKFGDELIFTEVKSRSNSSFGKPEQSVSAKKQRQLGKAAEQYILDKEYDGNFRFDIIAIEFYKKEAPKIFHFEDAFFPIGST